MNYVEFHLMSSTSEIWLQFGEVNKNTDYIKRNLSV